MIPAQETKPKNEFHDDPFCRGYRVLIFFGLLAFCAFIRLWDLGKKSMMHDELLFTFWTHRELFLEWKYLYEPILHGPLMLHIQNICFHLFGVSDYTVRLGVAFLGIGSFLWIWKLRYWLGEWGTWFALAFFTLSPGIAFFNRFFHQDALYLFCTLWIVASLANWWRTRDGRWAASALIAITALFTNKASAVFVYFSVFTFFLLVVIHDISAWLLEGKHRKLTGHLVPVPSAPRVGWFVFFVGGFVILALTQIFEGLRYEAFVTNLLGHDWVLRDVRSIPVLLGWRTIDPVMAPDAGIAASRQFWVMFYFGLIFGLIAVGGVARFAIEKRLGHREFPSKFWALVHENRWYLIGGLAFSIAFYLAIYTTFFKHKIGFFDIYARTWAYWGGQHEIGRIAGPFHQHMLNMVIYETPAVLIILGAWFIGLFRRGAEWTRTTGVAFIMMIVAFAAFHKLIFSGTTFEAIGPDYQVKWLKHLVLGGLVVGIVTIILPRSGRTLLPVSFVAMVAYSIAFLNSNNWSRALNSVILKDGENVQMMKRNVTLAEYIEVQFNFDGGWTILIVLMLIFFATIYTWRALDRGERFHGFLVWWTVTMIGSASYAREAVPQVGIHAMLPAILLSASYFDHFMRRTPDGMARRTAFFVVGFFVLWNMKSNFNMNFHQADDPRERMAYGPSNPDVKNHFDFIRAYERIASLRSENGRLTFTSHYNNRGKWKDVKIHMKPLDQVTWPAKWYLRDIEYKEGGDLQRSIDEGYHFLFIAIDDKDKLTGLENYNIARGRGTTFWTPNVISPASLGGIWKEWIPGHYLDGSPQAGPAWQSKQDWRTVWRYMILRETFEGTNRPVPSVSSFDYYFLYRKDLF